jgi:hypothetical protein
LLFGAGPSSLLLTTTCYDVTTDRNVVSLSGSTAVAASGTQKVRVRMQRDSGSSGTITAESGRCIVHWLIIPGAGTAV